MKDMPIARFVMVLSSVSPLLALWCLHGAKAINDLYFIPVCAFLAIAPTAFLYWRIRSARKQKLTAKLSIARAEDHKDHLLVYLFAMLLPFYAPDGESMRQFLALVAALTFVVFLFWHLNLHYMNILFAIFGYRIFTVYGATEGDPSTYQGGRVLITKRLSIAPSEAIVAFRISNLVYFEGASDET